ncbi:hypothetical protein [Amycolatopsis decaplanina]|uniref:Uncharacterized protein n=1 Tax=Amycolatopsis decaplanina DSM 44594 TaxID=1284240 RepID=M2ZSM5_9PSEU|nr:hypothetical protein [Amycolatopsis decaplanina]EME63349.1 hypothetical protein H074_05607 [Amycolatopsis decaplanina DSM 44594]
MAALWDVGHAASWAIRDEEEHPCLIAVVSLNDSLKRVSLGEFGVHYQDQHARGDLLHGCLHELPDEPTPFSLDVSGAPEHVAAECAAWFETILRRPVGFERRHNHHGQPYAEIWKFSDNGDVLSQSYNPAVAPRGQRKRLVRGGFVFGRGWTQVKGVKDPPSHERRVR